MKKLMVLVMLISVSMVSNSQTLNLFSDLFTVTKVENQKFIGETVKVRENTLIEIGSNRVDFNNSTYKTIFITGNDVEGTYEGYNYKSFIGYDNYGKSLKLVTYTSPLALPSEVGRIALLYDDKAYVYRVDKVIK